jgi:hypothetical protein
MLKSPVNPLNDPNDPRKKQQQPAQQQPGQQPGQQQPAQPAQPSQAVQSSLPPMQPQKKPAAPVTYQQQAGAVADPRFSQALAQKLQLDVKAKQAQLEQQQSQFQTELDKAAGGVPAQQRISDLLGRITSGQASEAELSEYDKLQKMQYQGPKGLEGTANIAALSQLAGSPELLAQQYAGFAPGGVRPGDFAKAMAGLQKSPGLASAQQAASKLAEKAMSAEEIAAQQAGLLKGQTEAAKTQAETAIKSEQEKYMAGLSEESKAEIESKKSALDRLKAGIFMGEKITQADLQKLGLTRDDLASLKGLNISQVEGIGEVRSVEDLNKAVEALNKKATEEGEETLTPEQQRLRGMFQDLSGLSRESDVTAGYGYAKKEDLAKINALRRLTGQAPIKEEDLAKGFESGKVGKQALSGLIGRQREFEGEYAGEAKAEQTLAGKQDRLTGNVWYKGGMEKALSDFNKPIKEAKYQSKGQEIAKTMMETMRKNKTTVNKLYGWIQKNYVGNKKGNETQEQYRARLTEFDKKLKNKLNENISSYKQSKSGLEQTLAGMSDISRALNIE